MRQVVFVKKGNTYVEGFGDITTDSSGKVTYKDQTLKFDDSVLTKANCEQ
jgi:heat shock protein HslJ